MEQLSKDQNERITWQTFFTCATIIILGLAFFTSQCEMQEDINKITFKSKQLQNTRELVDEGLSPLAARCVVYGNRTECTLEKFENMQRKVENGAIK